MAEVKGEVRAEGVFPSEAIRRAVLFDEDGKISWQSFLMDVGNAMFGDTPIDGLAGPQDELCAYVPWVQELGAQLAQRMALAMGTDTMGGPHFSMQLHAEPGLGLLFELSVSAAHASSEEQQEAEQQLSLFSEEQSESRWLVLPSSQLYQQTRHVISSGRDGLFTKAEGALWPSHHVEQRTFKADMVMQPTALPHEVMLKQESYQELFSRVQSHIDKMDDLTADVFDIISARWIQASPSAPGDMITLTADDFLAMRGLKANVSGSGRRGGYKETQRREVAQRIASLDQLWVNVQEMSGTVMEDGRRRRRKMRLQTKAIVVTMQAGEAVGDEEISPYAWRLRPGDGFAEFLLSDVGRETALMALRALEYNPERQYMEKRLTRYLSVQWRIRHSREAYIKPYKVATLLDAINEKLDARRPQRQRERLEKALDQLREDAVIAAWQYADGYDEGELTGRGWQDRWLAWGITIEPPAQIHAHYEGISPPKAAQAIKVPAHEAAYSHEDLRLANRVIQARARLKKTQAQVADQLGINRSALSLMETGKRRASADMVPKLRAWLEENGG